MIYLAIAELVVIVALIVRHEGVVGRMHFHSIRMQEEWATERSELVTRAMHPQVVLPPRHMQPAALPEHAEADDFERVGRVFSEDGEL